MYTLIIPSAKLDQLEPCIESVRKYTDFTKVRLLIIANGASRECKEYLEKEQPLEHIWFDKMIGFPKAINAGIKVAGNDDIIILNDDTILLPQIINTWITMLENLFKTDPKIGIVGPLSLYEYWVKQYYIQFFCAIIKHEVIEKIGLLDETFGWGNSEDLDYCIRAKINGYKIASIPVSFNLATTMKLADYPIFHMAHKTVDGIADFNSNAEKNIKIIQDRYKHLPPEQFEKETFI